MREKIKLESSAGTGHFYPPPRTSAPLRKDRNEKNSIRWHANTFSTRKLSSSNPTLVAGIKKARLRGLFFRLSILTRTAQRQRELA